MKVIHVVPCIGDRSSGYVPNFCNSLANNGISIPSGNVETLEDALLWIHDNYSKLPEMGIRSQELAKPFAAEFWADRVVKLCKKSSRKS